MTFLDRFWAKVDRAGECWVWTGATTAPGWHGVILMDGRRVIASRASWTIHYGPIPPGMLVLHSCDNPPCVRPDHLMLGSVRANMVDAGRKGRMGQAKHRRACVNGHDFTEANTYRGPKTGRRQCRLCRREAGRRKYQRHASRINETRRMRTAAARRERSCRWCRAAFMPTGMHNVYCSTRCRTKASWARHLARRAA